MPSATAQDERLGLLRITKAEYPVQVPRSYSFTVKLKIEYAFHDYFEIHAAVYEGYKGAFDRLLWEGRPERLIAAGENTYSVPLKSPSYEGPWVLTAYAFFRNDSRSDYFTDQERGPGFIEMSVTVADSAKLTLETPYGNVPVWIDSAPYSTDASGVLVHELQVLTEHSIAVQEKVLVAEGWRAIFKSWNGTDTENPMTVVMKTDLLLTIQFRDEFYLDVVSHVPNTRGAGWYPAGAVANFSASTLVPSKGWEGVLGAQWRFSGWSGDVVSSSSNESIVMDRAHRVVASWTLDYGGLYILTILAALLVACGFTVAYLGRRIVKRRSGEAEAPSVRQFCIFCGSEIDPDARFCSKCGKSQVNSE